jgi:UDP-glucose 4-epimerase
VLQVMAEARRVTKIEIPSRVSRRRLGDPAVLVASSDRARAELGWKPKFSDLETIIQSAWQWLREHPDGYKE